MGKKLFVLASLFLSGCGLAYAADQVCAGCGVTGMDKVTFVGGVVVDSITVRGTITSTSPAIVKSIFFADGTEQTTAGGAGGGGGAPLGSIQNNSAVATRSTISFNVPASMGEFGTATSSLTVTIYDRMKTTTTWTAQQIFSQRVGIGTTNPIDTLNVVQINDGQGIDYGLTLNNGGTISWADGAAGLGQSLAEIRGSTITKSVLIIAGGGGGQLFVSSNGVSVGSVVRPSSQLDIVGGSLTVRGAGAALMVKGSATIEGTFTSTNSVRAKSYFFADGSEQTTAGAGASGATNGSSWAGGKSTGPVIDLNGSPMTNVGSMTFTSPGPMVIASTNSGYIQASSATFYLDATSVTITQVQQGSTTQWKLAGGSVTVNGVYISTVNSQLIPFFGYNSVGVSTNIINVATSAYNGMYVFSVDASSPTLNSLTVRSWIPKGRNKFRDPILRDFTIAQASATGNLQSFDDGNEVFTISFCTSSSIVTLGTATYTNSQTVTVSGGAAPGGTRRVTDQTMNGIAALVGDGGRWLSAKVTAAGMTVNAAWMGMVIEFFDYQ